MASGLIGAMYPPPGVKPNFIDPPNQWHSNIALHTICLTLATAAVVMRLYTRYFLTNLKLGIDDCLCCFSYLSSAAFSALLIKCYEWGVGRHIWDVPAVWIVTTFKYFTFAQYVFLVMSTTIKLTFLFFYYRIFGLQTVSRWLVILGIVFVFCSNLGLLLTTIFSCTPIARAWNRAIPGHCFRPDVLPWVSGVLSAVTDLYVLILPVPFIWTMTMPMNKKIRVLGVFGLGLLACVASLIRLGMTPVLRRSPDITWNISLTAVWCILEANIAIICSCLILLPAFLEHHPPRTLISLTSRLWSFSFNRSHSSVGDTSPTTPQRALAKHSDKNDESLDFVPLRGD